MVVQQSGLWGGAVELQERAKIGALQERFIVPPFSILNARQGYWQERKRVWLRLGIQSELGRDAEISGGSLLMRGDLSYGPKQQSGTSIFCPVLCELIYHWFCPPNGKVLDPFAGGSVRGIVAAYLGYEYVGIELRTEQVLANRTQAKAIGVGPQWIVGDSSNIARLAPGRYDLLFTCPPYYDLEVYSDLPGELSALPSYNDFLSEYRQIIIRSIALLAPHRFACVVVGDIRDRKGYYRNFVSDTIAIFREAGCRLYNEAILITSIGSLPIRITKQFNAGRKLGKTHQNMLVFVKGDWRRAVAALNDQDGRK